jgi:hypothetical protein
VPSDAMNLPSFWSASLSWAIGVLAFEMSSQFLHVAFGIFTANDFLRCFLGYFDLHLV